MADKNCTLTGQRCRQQPWIDAPLTFLCFSQSPDYVCATPLPCQCPESASATAPPRRCRASGPSVAAPPPPPPLPPSRFWSPRAAFPAATEPVHTGTLSPKDAHHLFDELLRQATPVPERSLNGFLTTLDRTPSYHVRRSGRTLVVALFNRVRREDAGPQVASPTVCSYSILMDRCCRTHQPDLGLAFFCYLVKTGLKMNQISATTLLKCLCCVKQTDEAVEVLLHRMSVLGYVPNAFSYSIVLKSLCNNSMSQRSLDLLQTVAKQRGPPPLLRDAVEDNAAPLEGLRNHNSDGIEGFGLAELFLESPDSHSLEHSGLEASVLDLEDAVDVLATSPLEPFDDDLEVADSTKLCDFVATLASKKLASMSLSHENSEEIPAASVIPPATAPMEIYQVDPRDPIADKCNAFLSSVFRPVPPPILATPAPRHARAPKEVATTPRQSGRIEKQKQMEERSMLQLRSCSHELWAS
ncbi:hypothetical protein ACQ4PT_018519 [Festuca glaucescens]